jgi:hypothetical protein
VEATKSIIVSGDSGRVIPTVSYLAITIELPDPPEIVPVAVFPPVPIAVLPRFPIAILSLRYRAVCETDRKDESGCQRRRNHNLLQSLVSHNSSFFPKRGARSHNRIGILTPFEFRIYRATFVKA